MDERILGAFDIETAKESIKEYQDDVTKWGGVELDSELIEWLLYMAEKAEESQL